MLIINEIKKDKCTVVACLPRAVRNGAAVSNVTQGLELLELIEGPGLG
jgi:hypothetical protein